MKKNFSLIIGIAMIGFMAYQIKNGSVAWAMKMLCGLWWETYLERVD